MSSAVTFFTVESALRPQMAGFLADSRQRETSVLGIRSRVVLAWVIGGAVPLIAAANISLSRVSRSAIAISVWLVAIVAIVGGGFLSVAAAKGISEPLRRLRYVLARVEAGELDVEVEVDDAGEVGLLQAGVNNMVRGLRERRALHAALGAYVDESVARRILDEGVLLEGQEVEVTVLFLDVRDFTAFSETTPSEQIVARLNALWEVVIPILHENGGHANKFIGDAVLGVFGAPLPMSDHADQALNAARQILDSVDAQFANHVRIGIGIYSGTVVAGTVGGGGRLEFTVIGDVVNVAARVQDLTKQTGDRMLITDATQHELRSQAPLEPRGAFAVRGKAMPIELFAAN